MTTYIYTLTDPVTGTIRYVGKTINPNERLQQHLHNKQTTTRCGQWIAALARLHLKPFMNIVAEVQEDEDWSDVEQAWIEWGIAVGLPLLNIMHSNIDAPEPVNIETLDERIDRLKAELFDALNEKVMTG